MSVHNHPLSHVRGLVWALLGLCIGAGALAAQTVDVVKVISKKSERKVELPGEFMPYQSVAIRAKVTGFVEQVRVDRGSVVKEGELLASLVAPELTAQRIEGEAKVQVMESRRAEAEAKYVSAQSTHDKLKAASQTPGVVAGNDLLLAQKAMEAAQAQVHALEESAKAAQSTVQALKDMESYLRVTAPFHGIITERNIHPGALVGPGANSPPMFQLEQNSRLRLVVAVPEVSVAGIEQGARVTFSVPAYPGEGFSAPIARIAHSIDPKTRSMAVELDVNNTGGRLAPGMYPTVSWPVHRAKPSLLVPATSVVTTTERTFVIRVRDGIAEWVNVSRGAADRDQVEVFGPLGAGDLVVQRATDELREGAHVNARLVAKPS
jgi:membrane fusion protein (multidrug efflux system)